METAQAQKTASVIMDGKETLATTVIKITLSHSCFITAIRITASNTSLSVVDMKRV